MAFRPLGFRKYGFLTGTANVAFTPAALFASGEQGAWYDPSDLSTMFQDTAGTTPVTAAGQQVGLLLDKSQGLVLGPELVTNGGPFITTTGWTARAGCTLSAVSGWLRLTYTGTGAARANFLTLTTVAGRTYKVLFAVRNTASTSTAAFFAYSDAFATQIGTSGSKTADGLYELVFTATTTTTNIDVGNSASNGGVGAYLEFNNISVKELPGNHATQATAAQRPTYGVVPATGRRNLLTGITVNPTTTSGLTLFGDTAATLTVVNDAAALAAAGLSNIASNNTVYRLNNTAGTTDAFVRFDNALTMGAVTWSLSAYVRGSGTSRIDVNAGTWSGSGATSLTGAYQRQVTTGVTNTSTNQWRISVGGGGEVYFIMMQAEVGAAATNYQSARTAFDVTEAGVASLSYVSFDGTDDGMVTNTITPGIDKAQVFAGVRKLSDAALGALVESSSNPGAANPGWFTLSAPRTAATGDYSFNANGTATATGATTGNSFAAPITNVLTGTADLGGDNVVLRVNGVQQASSALDRGTGNFLAYPLYIGRRGGTSLPFNGRIYQMIVRFGANLSAATITQTETFVNSRTGAY